MGCHGGTIASPIVISDDEEDAALVDQQLQYIDDWEAEESVPEIGFSGYSDTWSINAGPSDTKESRSTQGVYSQGNLAMQTMFDGRFEPGVGDLGNDTKKRKRDEITHLQPSTPQMKKQKKKKSKQKQKSFPPTYPQALEPNVVHGYASAHEQNDQHWPSSAYNSHSQASSSYNLGPILTANGPLISLPGQSTLFQAQGQNIPLDATFQGGYYNSTLPPAYQQFPQSLPPKPSYHPPALPAMHISEGIYSAAETKPFVPGVPLMPSRSHEYNSYDLALYTQHYSDTDRVSQYSLSSLPPPPRLPPSSIPPPRIPPPSIPPPLLLHAKALPNPGPTAESSSAVRSHPLPIGLPSDPKSTHGLFTLPPGKSFQTTCTLVMENVPRSLRNDSFIRTWSQRAAGIVPSYHLFNDRGKVLLVYQSAHLAKKAFDSPRMPPAKGQEGIRLWWYRETQSHVQPTKFVKGHSPKAEPEPMTVDLEEGEIEETGASKEHSGVLSDAGPIDASAWNNPFLSKKARKRLRAAQLQSSTTSTALRTERLYSVTSQNAEVKSLETGKWVPSSRVSDSHPLEISNNYADSIASSTPGSPLPDVASRQGDVSDYQFGYPNDDGVQDMELDSPVSPRYSQESQRDIIDVHKSLSSSVQLPAKPATDADTAVGAPLDVGAFSETNKDRLRTPYTFSDLQGPTDPVVIAQPTPLALQTRELYASAPTKSVLVHRQTPPTSTPTPPLDAPSEPRAMRNAGAAPRGPRTLSERTKELEQRLARSKHEMGRPLDRNPVALQHESVTASTKTASTSSLPHPPAHLPARPPPQGLPAQPPVIAPSKSPLSPSPVQAADSVVPSPPVIVSEITALGQPPADAGDKLSMEENLRRLVLQSRKSKSKAQPIAPEDVPKKVLLPLLSQPSKTSELPLTPSQDDHQVSVTSVRADSGQGNTIAESATSLDDLANSFINDAIHGIPSSLPSSSVKIDLAAKQKRLEQHISETKRLMAKLTAASSKHERESILSLLREQTRMMDEDVAAERPRDPLELETTTGNELSSKYPPTKPSWPETSRDVVLDLSDDEDN